MNKLGSSFYTKLALSNMRKNSRIYLPYLLTCIGSVMMFYNMMYIAVSEGLAAMPGAESVGLMMSFGVVVIGIFSFVFLLYTNSFVIKQRKKELGLYGILGMEKRHVSRLVFVETALTSLISIGAGLLFGILFSQLALMILLRILDMSTPLRFEVNPMAIIVTVALFAAIFFITMIRNQIQVGLSRPVELLRGGSVGEREPKTRWLLALIGAVTLGLGYYISLTVENPIDALFFFFAAVLLVVIGTYCLFVAGSITVLKLLRSNKHYYYRARPFISVSGMIYRMKQNGVGLANVCLLATMVLVMVTTTVALYIGSEQSLDGNMDSDVEITLNADAASQLDTIEQICRSAAAEHGLNISDYESYTGLSVAFARDGSVFDAGDDAVSAGRIAMVYLMTDKEHLRATGEELGLSDGQAAVFSVRQVMPEEFSIMGLSYTVAKRLEATPAEINLGGLRNYEAHVVVVTEKDYNAIYERQVEVYTQKPIGAPSETQSNVFFCLDGDRAEQADYTDALSGALKEQLGGDLLYLRGKASIAETYYDIYGGFIFLGVFLGLIFIMAAALIIYYKQINEGLVDRERFHIMQKVGMSAQEVRRSIRGQILTVFFLPLAAAGLHLTFASPILLKLLGIFGLNDTQLYVTVALCTAAALALIYVLVYTLTAKAYYRIVRFGDDR